jgi:hypothetical protein
MRTAGRSLFRECANGSPRLQCSSAFSDSDPHRKYDTYGRSAQPRRRSFGFRSKGMTEAREVDFYFCAVMAIGWDSQFSPVDARTLRARHRKIAGWCSIGTRDGARRRRSKRRPLSERSRGGPNVSSIDISDINSAMQNCTRTPFCSSREATIQSPGRVRRESAAAAGRGSRCGIRRICSRRTSGRCGRLSSGRSKPAS